MPAAGATEQLAHDPATFDLDQAQAARTVKYSARYDNKNVGISMPALRANVEDVPLAFDRNHLIVNRDGLVRLLS